MPICSGAPWVEIGAAQYANFQATGSRGYVAGSLNGNITLPLRPGDASPTFPNYIMVHDHLDRPVAWGLALGFTKSWPRGFASPPTFSIPIVDFAWFTTLHQIEDYTAFQAQTLEQHTNNLLRAGGAFSDDRDFNAIGLFSGGGVDELAFSVTDQPLFDSLNRLYGSYGKSWVLVPGWENFDELVLLSENGGAVCGIRLIDLATGTPSSPFPVIQFPPVGQCDYEGHIFNPEITVNLKDVITRVTILGANANLRSGGLIHNVSRPVRYDIPPASEARHFALDPLVRTVGAIYMRKQVKIYNWTPATGPVGTTVTLSGVYFANTTDVAVGATPATSFTVVSDSEIQFDIPAGATTAPIIVTTSDADTTSTITDFTVT